MESNLGINKLIASQTTMEDLAKIVETQAKSGGRIYVSLNSDNLTAAKTAESIEVPFKTLQAVFSELVKKNSNVAPQIIKSTEIHLENKFQKGESNISSLFKSSQQNVKTEEKRQEKFEEGPSKSNTPRPQVAINKVFSAVLGGKDFPNDFNSVEIHEQITAEFSKLSENPQQFLKIGDKKFFISVSRDSNNAEFIEVYQRVGLLGNGSFGKVHSFVNIDTGEIHAMKLAKTKQKGEAAIEDVKGERDKLMEYNPRVNGQELKEGIQAPPHLIVNANGKVGYMGVKYQGDGAKLFEMLNKSVNIPPGRNYHANELAAKKSIMNQLINGTQSLIDLGKIHNDVKSANVLFKGNIDEGFTAVHADFGLDEDINETLSKLDREPMPDIIKFIPRFTSAYASSLSIFNIQSSMNDIVNAKNDTNISNEERDSIINNSKNAIKERLPQMTQFSLALVLFDLYTGEYPDVQSFKGGGIIFGGEDGGSFLEDIQTCLDQMYEADVPQDVQDKILELMGKGRDFDLNEDNELDWI